jgi:N-acetyltransferase
MDGNPIARAILRQQAKAATRKATKTTKEKKTADDVIIKKKTRFGLDTISNFDDRATNAECDDEFDDDDDGFATKTFGARKKRTPLKSAVSFTRRKRKGGCFLQPAAVKGVDGEKANEEEEEKSCKVRFTLRASDDETFSKKHKKTTTTHKQMYLDLGQKSFAHATCSTCGLMYAKGEPSDEELHRKYHAKFLEERDNAFVTVNVNGTNSFWFDERKQNWQEVEIVRKDAPSSSSESEKCRVYRVTKGGCDRHAWAKVKRVAKIVETEIGAVEEWVLGGEEENTDLHVVAFVCVSFTGGKANEGKIIGAAFCEDIAANQREVFASTTAGGKADEKAPSGKDSSTTATTTTTTSANDNVRGGGVLKKGARIQLSSQTRDSVGIRALWVHKKFRRAGVSYNLLENCRRRFYGDASMIGSSTIVEKDRVAFSQPTYQGELFIAKYAGNGGFLVYE